VKRNGFTYVLVLASLCVAASACGGGGHEAQGLTPQPTIAVGVTPQGTPVALPTAVGTPIITDSLFRFPAKGYEVGIPQGWEARPNFLITGAFSSDAFFAPETGAAVQPSIAVTCEPLVEETTLQAYFETRLDLVKRLLKQEPEVRPFQVVGREAFAVQYSLLEDSPLDRTDIIFLSERCGWTISLTAPFGQRAAYQGIFDQFLASFRLLP